jgi:outer membrane protein OmpA-like peptidoglycan-associated protein
MTRTVLGVVAFVAAAFLLLPYLLSQVWISSAAARLQEAEAAAEAEPEEQVIAAAADESYCTPGLRIVLRRVLQSCGLITAGGGRGCRPVEARSVATMDDADFNALFVPMRNRGGIVQFDRASATMDNDDMLLLDRTFANRRGASYFLVVARASPEGTVELNRDLSRRRAEAILEHLRTTFGEDPELEGKVGLLWLGEEYAQLDPSFCSWGRSGGEADCSPEDLNRSAFIAWIDCRL